MKAKGRLLTTSLFMILFLLNVSFISDRSSEMTRLSYAEHLITSLSAHNLLFFAIPEEEEPIDGGDVGTATITCSGGDSGRCFVFTLETCEFNMYTQTTLEASCMFVGRPEYYCPALGVMIMNFICSPLSW